jgi:Tfp pilus assembly protein PilO
MKATDRSILAGLVILGLLACFWFVLLAPKRERATELDAQVSDLQDEVAQQEQIADAAESSQDDYGRNYQSLIVLGQAAPADGDTPSLLAQLTELSEQSKTKFDSLVLSGDAPTIPAPAAQTTTDQNAEAGAPTASSAEPAPAEPAAATEASVSVLPLGATVGPAGLGVLPYNVRFSGDFFQVADLLAGLDSLVGSDEKGTKVDGRLVTVNGFTIAPPEPGLTNLNVDLSISAYVLPDSQGLTAGATPAAPSSGVPAASAVPTSTAPTP